MIIASGSGKAVARARMLAPRPGNGNARRNVAVAMRPIAAAEPVSQRGAKP